MCCCMSPRALDQALGTGITITLPEPSALLPPHTLLLLLGPEAQSLASLHKFAFCNPPEVGVNVVTTVTVGPCTLDSIRPDYKKKKKKSMSLKGLGQGL